MSDPGTPIPAAIRPPLFTEAELAGVQDRLARLVDLDLEAYKPRQIARRIAALMSRHGATSLEAYVVHLETDADARARFVDGLTINVSAFFRDPERFDDLRARILPELVERFGPALTIWSAGCSMGAELYSVAFLLEEAGLLSRATLIGTDVDSAILERASEARFFEHEIEQLPERFASRFVPDGQSWRLEAPELLEACRFERQNLLEAWRMPPCHLILCRNVVIYFNEGYKQRLYARLAETLLPGGVLFVGSAERIFSHHLPSLRPHGPFFYQHSPEGASRWNSTTT